MKTDLFMTKQLATLCTAYGQLVPLFVGVVFWWQGVSRNSFCPGRSGELCLSAGGSGGGGPHGMVVVPAEHYMP